MRVRLLSGLVLGILSASLLLPAGLTAAPPHLLVAAACAAGVVEALLALARPLPPTMAQVLGLGLLWLLWAASRTSLDPYNSHLSLASWGGALGLGAATASVGLGRAGWRWLSRGLVFILSWAALASLVRGSPGARLAGNFTNADNLALLMALGLVLAGTVVSRASWRVRAAVVPGALALGAALLFTGSRAGLLAALAGLLVLGGHRGGRLALVLAGLLLLALSLHPSSLERWRELSQPTQGLQLRKVVLETLPELVRRYPWGSGLGTYPLVFSEVRPWGIYGYVNAAHNDWVQIAVESGVVGSALALAGLGQLLLACWRRPGAEARAALGLLTTTGVYAALNFAVPVPADLLWCGAAWGLALGCACQTQIPTRAWLGVALGLVLAVACALGLNLAARGVWAQAAARSAQAQLAALDLEEALRWARLAVAREPANPQNLLLRSRVLRTSGYYRGKPELLSQARQDVEGAAQLSPRSLLVRREWARLLLEQGNLEGAQGVLEETLAKSPHEAGTWARLAQVRLDRGDRRGAQAALWEASRDYPELLPTLVQLRPEVRLLADWAAREPVRVESFLVGALERGPDETLSRALLALHPDHPVATRARALLCRSRHDLAGERRWTRSWLQVEDSEEAALAWAHLQQGSAWLTERVQSHPWEVGPRLLLATQLSPGQARSLLEVGLQRNPEQRQLLEALARLCEANGEPELGRRYRERASSSK